MSFPNPQDMSLRLWLSLRWCLERSNYIKMGSLGRLTQSACCLNKERLGTDTNTQASSQESPAKTRGRPQKPALLALPSKEGREPTFYHLSHLLCGIELWLPCRLTQVSSSETSLTSHAWQPEQTSSHALYYVNPLWNRPFCIRGPILLHI